MISSERKTKIISDAARAKNDTGSPEVQVSLMTERIKEITDHLKLHKKDNHSRRGLLQLVGKRKRLMTYLKSENIDAYHKLIEKLGIRAS
jgi:small subunit ribosomal protein S15